MFGTGRNSGSPFNRGLMYYSAGRDQPLMWGGGRDPMRSGEFAAPALALRNRWIEEIMRDRERPASRIRPFTILGRELNIDPSMVGDVTANINRSLLASDLSRKFSQVGEPYNAALSGMQLGDMFRSWLGQHRLDKAQKPSNGLFKQFFGIV